MCMFCHDTKCPGDCDVLFQLVHPRDQDLSFVLLKIQFSTIKKNITRTNAHELL